MLIMQQSAANQVRNATQNNNGIPTSGVNTSENCYQPTNTSSSQARRRKKSNKQYQQQSPLVGSILLLRTNNKNVRQSSNPTKQPSTIQGTGGPAGTALATASASGLMHESMSLLSQQRNKFIESSQQQNQTSSFYMQHERLRQRQADLERGVSNLSRNLQTKKEQLRDEQIISASKGKNIPLKKKLFGKGNQQSKIGVKTSNTRVKQQTQNTINNANNLADSKPQTPLRQQKQIPSALTNRLLLSNGLQQTTTTLKVAPGAAVGQVNEKYSPGGAADTAHRTLLSASSNLTQKKQQHNPTVGNKHWTHKQLPQQQLLHQQNQQEQDKRTTHLNQNNNAQLALLQQPHPHQGLVIDSSYTPSSSKQKQQKRFKTLQTAQSQPRKSAIHMMQQPSREQYHHPHQNQIAPSRHQNHHHRSLQQRTRKKTKMLFTNSYYLPSNALIKQKQQLQQLQPSQSMMMIGPGAGGSSSYLNLAAAQYHHGGYQEGSSTIPSQTVVQYQTSTLSTPDRHQQHPSQPQFQLLQEYTKHPHQSRNTIGHKANTHHHKLQTTSNTLQVISQLSGMGGVGDSAFVGAGQQGTTLENQKQPPAAMFSRNNVLQTIKSEVHLRKEKSRQRERILRQLASEIGAGGLEMTSASQRRQNHPQQHLQYQQQSAAFTTIQYDNEDDDDQNHELLKAVVVGVRDDRLSSGCFSSTSSHDGGDSSQMMQMIAGAAQSSSVAAARNHLNLNHGRSQSSFRSYTNHHMGSGSNHCVTEDDEGDEDEGDEDEMDEMDDEGEFIIDCESRQEQQSSNNQQKRHQQQQIAPVATNRTSTAGLVVQSLKSPPLRNKDEQQQPTRRMNKLIHQPSNEQVLGLETEAEDGRSRTAAAAAQKATMQMMGPPHANTTTTLYDAMAGAGAINNNYQTNASTMHFATSQHNNLNDQILLQYFNAPGGVGGGGGPQTNTQTGVDALGGTNGAAGNTTGGFGSRPATANGAAHQQQQQVLQSTGEFIVPDYLSSRSTGGDGGASATTKGQRNKQNQGKEDDKGHKLTVSKPTTTVQHSSSSQSSQEDVLENPRNKGTRKRTQRRKAAGSGTKQRCLRISLRPDDDYDDSSTIQQQSQLHKQPQQLGNIESSKLNDDDQNECFIIDKPIGKKSLQANGAGAKTQESSPHHRQNPVVGRLVNDAFTMPVAQTGTGTPVNRTLFDNSGENVGHLLIQEFDRYQYAQNQYPSAKNADFAPNTQATRDQRKHLLQLQHYRDGESGTDRDGTNFPLIGLIGRNARTTQQSSPIYQTSSAFRYLNQPLGAVGPQQLYHKNSSNLIKLKKQHVQKYGKQKSTYASRQKDFSQSNHDYQHQCNSKFEELEDFTSLADYDHLPRNQQAFQRQQLIIQTNAVEQASKGFCCGNFCVQSGSNHQIIIENTANQHKRLDNESWDERRDNSVPNRQSRQFTEMSLSSRYVQPQHVQQYQQLTPNASSSTQIILNRYDKNSAMVQPRPLGQVKSHRHDAVNIQCESLQALPLSNSQYGNRQSSQQRQQQKSKKKQTEDQLLFCCFTNQKQKQKPNKNTQDSEQRSSKYLINSDVDPDYPQQPKQSASSPINTISSSNLLRLQPNHHQLQNFPQLRSHSDNTRTSAATATRQYRQNYNQNNAEAMPNDKKSLSKQNSGASSSKHSNCLLQ